MAPSVGLQMFNKYNVSRLGHKLTVEELKVLFALPRDVITERTWAEVLQKEDIELVVLEMREEIFEEAFRVCYQRYMDRQTAPFTAHCAAQAWLKLINWHFYRHDPGEDPTAYPPCFIPKRVESWIPDEMPDPSPKDSWGRQKLNIIEEVVEESVKKWPSSESIDLPVVEEIPREYWFPGKILIQQQPEDDESEYEDTVTFDESMSSDLAAESELLQKVTDYTPEEDVSIMESVTAVTGYSSQRLTTTETTEARSSLRGAGDSPAHHRRSQSGKFTRSMMGRSRGLLPPLQSDSRSRISVISDCRLRSLRVDTQYEISSEKIESPPKDPTKRK